MRLITVGREESERLRERFAHFLSNDMYRGEEGKEFFLKALSQSDLVVEYPYGMVRFDGYRPGESIRVHALFDRKSALSEEAVEDLKALVGYVFRHFNVNRIEALIPSGSRALKRLLYRIGFRYFGELPKGLFDGKMNVDGTLYRIRR
jgi:hypothetical protein